MPSLIKFQAFSLRYWSRKVVKESRKGEREVRVDSCSPASITRFPTTTYPGWSLSHAFLVPIHVHYHQNSSLFISTRRQTCSAFAALVFRKTQPRVVCDPRVLVVAEAVATGLVLRHCPVFLLISAYSERVYACGCVFPSSRSLS